jgi:glucose/arabinose dehydrogenase
MRIAILVSLGIIAVLLWQFSRLVERDVHAVETFESSAGPLRVESVVERLDHPWSVAFLPGDELLISERGGKLLHFDAEGNRNVVYGLPPIEAVGQGGLMDVVPARDFAESRTIFLTYTAPEGTATRTALASARLHESAGRVTELRVLWEQEPPIRSRRHFGSRVVEAPDGTLWVTIGDRANRELAQHRDKTIGKVIRVNRDGTIPEDNPFVGDDGVHDAIWSLGHRNPQGAALDPETGALWIVEHGARGGDEINRPEAGRNYGWPVISYGVHYSGEPIGEGTHKEGMEQPVHYWDPSIAPSGMAIYSGRLWPEWEGDIFVGALKFELISRLDRQGDGIAGEERLFAGRFGRIRHVAEGPEGALWFLTDEDNGALYRVTPAG